MELALNLVWAALAIAIVCMWLRFAPRSGCWSQIVALAVLILILFPVISVTDDLQALQNPAEADSCLRRDQTVSAHHAVFPAAATLPLPALAELSFGFLRFVAPGNIHAPLVEIPAMASIQNRPPPAA